MAHTVTHTEVADALAGGGGGDTETCEHLLPVLGS